MHQQEPGLNSSDALLILHNELQNELRASACSRRNGIRRKLMWMSFLHHNCVFSLFHWTSALVLLLCALFLFMAFCIQDNGWLCILFICVCAWLVEIAVYIWFIYNNINNDNKKIPQEIICIIRILFYFLYLRGIYGFHYSLIYLYAFVFVF